MPPEGYNSYDRFKRDEDEFDLDDYYESYESIVAKFSEPKMLSYHPSGSMPKDGPISNPPCTIEQLFASCGMKEEF